MLLQCDLVTSVRFNTSPTSSFISAKVLSELASPAICFRKEMDHHPWALTEWMPHAVICWYCNQKNTFHHPFLLTMIILCNIMICLSWRESYFSRLDSEATNQRLGIATHLCKFHIRVILYLNISLICQQSVCYIVECWFPLLRCETLQLVPPNAIHKSHMKPVRLLSKVLYISASELGNL